jgi:hypothetical protein
LPSFVPQRGQPQLKMCEHSSVRGRPSRIQVKALEEGVSYQTLIASVLHKYVTRCLLEQPNPAEPEPYRVE